MNEARFDKRLELIFGLQYYIKRKYNVQFEWILENHKEYNDKFYNLCENYISKEFEDYIINGGLHSYNRCVDLALHMDDEFNIIDKDTLDYQLLNSNKVDIDKIEQFIKEFVSKSSYNDFFSSNNGYYKSVIDKYYEAINHYGKIDVNKLIDFYGYKKGEMNVLLLDFSNGSYGCTYGQDLFFVCGVVNASGRDDVFEFSNKMIINVYHEFSHPYINPLGEKYNNSQELPNIYLESKDNGLQSSYNRIITILNEYVVRAISIYLVKELYNTERFNKIINYNKEAGFPHIEEIIKLLDKRKEYDDFEDFYKEVIYKYFVELNSILESKYKNKNIIRK